MAKKKTRQKKSMSSQHQKRHGLALGVPQTEADIFMALYNAKRLPQAQRAAQKMAEQYPNSAFAWKALGTCYLEAGEAQSAIDTLLKAYKLDAEDSLTLTSLAAAYYRQGDEQQALYHQRKAVDKQSDYAPAQYRLAEMLQSAGKYKEALQHSEKALMLGYDELAARLLLGALQYQAKDFNKALENYLLLEKKFDDNHHVLNNLGNLYKDIGQYELAEEYYQKALLNKSDYLTAYSNVFFTKHYNPSATQEEIRNFAKGWNDKFSLNRMEPSNVRKDASKPLKVGLLSSGFRLHPVGQMIASALEYSRSDIHFYAYSTNDVNDHITQKIRDACTQWLQIRHLSQEAIADQIRSDKIDILIDLSGHSDGNCLQAISMRPAPLCVKWVGGLVNTMGLDSIDYLLSDSIETPEGVDEHYFEKLVRLPDDYICYVPCSYAPPITSLPALKNRYLTLGCLNNPAKISTELLSEWAVLMHQLTDSHLLLRGPQYESKDFCQWLRGEMAQQGIDESRVQLEGPTDHREFLATYQRIDIALDTWPYSGGLTTCEALLMGVPVVTLPGPTFAGRHSATHLINTGLPELVTNSWDEYRQRVIELANDLPNLAVIRAGLRTILHYSPVCDAPRFANHFNNALRAIWQRYCQEKVPEALTFNKEGEMWFANDDKLVKLPECRSDESVESGTFEWQIDEPITIIDNAAVLPQHPDYPKWMSSGHLTVISFDPTSLLNKKVEELKTFGELHHYPHALLGDGKPEILYATVDAEKSSTLRPLSEEQQPKSLRNKLKVLAELPINTVALDSIKGLSSVDMLVLDELHDALKILENGHHTLKDTLLIQVKVAFQLTYKRQSSLPELLHWSSKNGFKLYSLKNFQYYSHLPKDMAVEYSLGSELMSTNILLLPSSERMQSLSNKQRMHLAFLLNKIYGIHDISYKLLAQIDKQVADQYLEKFVATSASLQKIDKDNTYIPQENLNQSSGTAASSREAALSELKSALGSRKMVFVNTGNMANHGIVQMGQKRLFDILDAADCPVDFVDTNEATPQKLMEIATSGEYVLYGANRCYDMSVNISGYGNYNVFQAFKRSVIGTINDHPYTNFMLDRIAKAPSTGLFIARASFGYELEFMRPDLKYVVSNQVETMPQPYLECDKPHAERDIDILVPMNLDYTLYCDKLNSKLMSTANGYGRDYRKLVERVLSRYNDFSHSLLLMFREIYKDIFFREWFIQLPWSQEDLKLLKLLGLLDDLIRANKRLEAMKVISRFESSARVVILAPVEMRDMLYRTMGGSSNVLNWHFIGTQSFEELQKLYTRSRYVLNVFPTYHNWLHERVRGAAIAGCALITNSNERAVQLFTHGENVLFYEQHDVDELYSVNANDSEYIGIAGRELLKEKLIEEDEGISQMFTACAAYLKQFNAEVGKIKSTKVDSASIELPSVPHMSQKERELFKKVLDKANSYFEFGSGGSTVWAVQKGLVVKGVESDKSWVDALKKQLGEKCQLDFVDIGPTGEWGVPTSNRFAEKFKNYSRSILDAGESFDLILVDGRFRIACTLAAILHILSNSDTSADRRIFIHDFWNRPIYHVVLSFLETVDRVDSAGVFVVKPGVSVESVRSVYERYVKDVR